MKYKYIFIFIFFIISLASINAQTTLQDYLDEEQSRLTKVDSIMLLVENYIISNIANYSFDETELNSIIDDLQNNHDGNTNPIIGNELDGILEEIKKNNLYDLYFIQNPNNKLYFAPTEIPVYLKQACINGGFESGLANYNFRESNISTPEHFDEVECSTIDNLDSELGPNSTLDNLTGFATLVSPGNEPYLENLDISINKVLTGNRAIKLNPSSTVQNNQTGNRVSMSRSFTLNENQIEFSFLYYGHTTEANSNNLHEDPFFRYRLIDNTTNTELFSNCYSANNNDCRFNVIADPTLGNQENDQISYTPNWVCERIDTSQWIGQDVTLEFLVSDCEHRGHFSTVYIDNICGVSCTPTFGDIQINPLNLNCPNSNFEVCGNFDLPNGTNLTSITLDIIDNSTNTSINQLTNPIINNNDYCFTIDYSIFGLTPSSNYSFQVTLNNTSNCVEFNQLITEGGLISFDNCSDPCDVITDTSINGDILSWVSSATSFELEFVSDGNCCPYGEGQIDPPVNISYTVNNSNSINLSNVYTDLTQDNSFKCFRYRIKSDCGEWSDWCCISLASGGGFENPYPYCFPNSPCENLLPITLTSPNDNINSSSGDVDYTNYASITALNKIESGYNSQYIASNFISLSEGFHAKAGSLFLARIQECVDIEIVPTPSSKKLSAQNEFNLKVYPNPAENQVNLSIKTQKIKSYILYDLQGKIIKVNTNVKDYSHSINVNHLSRGFYILKVTLEDNSVHNNNLILK